MFRSSTMRERQAMANAWAYWVLSSRPVSKMEVWSVVTGSDSLRGICFATLRLPVLQVTTTGTKYIRNQHQYCINGIKNLAHLPRLSFRHDCNAEIPASPLSLPDLTDGTVLCAPSDCAAVFIETACTGVHSKTSLHHDSARVMATLPADSVNGFRHWFYSLKPRSMTC